MHPAAHDSAGALTAPSAAIPSHPSDVADGAGAPAAAGMSAAPTALPRHHGALSRAPSLRPEFVITSIRRSMLVTKELDRLCSAGRVAPPKIPTDLSLRRDEVAYNNGWNVKGLRVEAFNAVKRSWTQGTIESAHVRSPPRASSAGAAAGRFVVVVVKHETVKDRAYEVAFLRRVAEE